MKRVTLIVSGLLLITVLSCLPIMSVYAEDVYDHPNADCAHASYYGGSLEWTLYDESVSVGIGANHLYPLYGDWGEPYNSMIYWENVTFQRIVGYGLSPTYMSSEAWNVYWYMDTGFNFWPYTYEDDYYWTYEYIDNPGQGPPGQWYYNQTHICNDSWWMTTRVYAATGSFFRHPYSPDDWYYYVASTFVGEPI